ncbi:ankyrin repeat domain-containing protein 65-like [Ischnura elegans]|uniref:ankyrin repeat domain-containing protein 65-like n=1 Tax=Ischnura elegans TaxID=197161 RepID=UPI001ED89934|nr:ankyrin repeat domain-containing protein 65-like [Ischnura elegans]
MDPSHCLPGHILKSIVVPASVSRRRHPNDVGIRKKRSRGADVVLAVRQCDFEALERLLREEGADPDEGLGATTPLAMALALGAYPCVEALLRLGADPRRRSVDAQGRIEPPLVAAVRLGCPPPLCRLLLDHGADPDARDFYGHSALWTAVYHKRAELMELLLNRGAKVAEWSSAGERVPLPWNECPLYEAARQGWRWCLPLVSCGAWGSGGLLEVVLERGDAGAAKGLVLAAGLRIPPGADCLAAPAGGDPCALRQWLQHEMASPPPLARLCRHGVRACLSRAARGRDLTPRAAMLPLPPHLLRYVLLDPLGP